MPHYLILENDKSMEMKITTRKDSWYDQYKVQSRT